MEITENEYLRFGGLKRLLIENNIGKEAIGELYFNKKDFSTCSSYFLDQELQELQCGESFWTEYDYDKHSIDDTEFSFSRPVEKFNSTYYSHYAVVKNWFMLTEKIKDSIKKSQIITNFRLESKNLFQNPLTILDTSYFQMVRKVCDTTSIFQSLKEDEFTFHFLYETDGHLTHSIILVTSAAGAEVHIPFYGLYGFFYPDELPVLPQCINYVEGHFSDLLSEIEQNHDSYMEEKYGDQFIKLKKNEMQYELHKQLGEILSKRFSAIVLECCPEAATDCQINNNALKAIISKKNQRYTFNFTLSELKNVLDGNENSLKVEIQKMLCTPA